MSVWTLYLRLAPSRPTDGDRARLEGLAGASLPDAYWAVACEHQGQVLAGGRIEVPGQGLCGFGVLLLVLPRAQVDRYGSYLVEACLGGMQPYYPAGLFPFADDTGGNFWALDLRADPASPTVVFIDHETAGEAGLTRAGDSFDAFMTEMGAPLDAP